VKEQQPATHHESVRQDPQILPRIFRGDANGRRAFAGGGANSAGFKSLAGPHRPVEAHLKPRRGALGVFAAGTANVAIPGTSDRWQGLSGQIAGLFQERLGARETKRRLLHASPGFLPFLLWAIPHDPPSSLRFLCVISGLILALAAVAYYEFGRVQRTAERSRDVMSAVFGYATVVLVTMLLCPQHVEIAFAALAVLAFGDGSATLGGMLLRGRRLPWNSKKTIAGTVCFILVATPMAALIYWGQAHDVYESANVPHVDFRMALLGALTAAVAAALVESLPGRTNDNLRVGATAALVIVLFQWLVVGWA
jgi:dolichol kinase